jgi:hypothetical protein
MLENRIKKKMKDKIDLLTNKFKGGNLSLRSQIDNNLIKLETKDNQRMNETSFGKKSSNITTEDS